MPPLTASDAPSPASKAGNARPRIRMAAGEREQMILDAAVHFFAVHGFSAGIRDLARELKVSQGLIYRYFPTKQHLLDRVYEQSFLSRWDPQWEKQLRDRSRPLAARLKSFYTSYLTAIDDPDWIRLSMYSGLDGNDLTHRYIRSHVESLLRLIARECQQSGDRGRKPNEAEMEMAWHLHSTAIYYLVRKHIFRTPATGDIPGLVATVVDGFLSGLPKAGSAALQAPQPKRKRRPAS